MSTHSRRVAHKISNAASKLLRISKRDSNNERPSQDQTNFQSRFLDAVIEGRAAAGRHILGGNHKGSVVAGTGLEDLLAHEEHQEHAWFLIEPQSPWVAGWDGVTSATLLFIAIFTPFEVAFLPAPTKEDLVAQAGLGFVLFVLGRVVDAIFIIDMLLQCFVMVPKIGSPEKLETRWGVIVSTYLQGWFLLDLFSLGASAFDIIPLLSGTADGKKSPVTSFRVVRVLRLAKLIRLVRASARLKEFSVRMAWPRAVITVFSTLVECFFVSHLVACTLGLVTIIPDSPLDTWLATHGYCRPNGLDESGERLFECRGPFHLYVQCIWWGGGMLFGAPISLTPNKGPYPEHYSGLNQTDTFGGTDGTVVDYDQVSKLTTLELITIFILKILTAFIWVTVIARFVQVYNNLDPDSRDFQMGWDALNRFVNYFKVTPTDARELRRYYIERADEAKAKSRKRVMNDFSPLLAEKFVWKLNKEWLMKVPCFSLVVERLILRPESGMERFLVKVALAMQPSVYVPSERPPAQRLYIITEGSAFHRGRQITKGDSWGAEDVLLRGSHTALRAFRALATTYLHVLWIGADTFDRLGIEHREAYMLVKLWATVYAAGRAILEQRRKLNKLNGAIKIGDKPGQISAAEVERRINNGLCKVIAMWTEDGKRQVNAHGQPVFNFKYRSLDLRGYEIVREVKSSGLRREHWRRRQEYVYYVRPHVTDGSALDAEPSTVLLSAGSFAADDAEGERLSCGPFGGGSVTSANPSVSRLSASELFGSSSFSNKPSKPLVPANPAAAALTAQLESLKRVFEQQTQAMNLQLQSIGHQVSDMAAAPSGSTSAPHRPRLSRGWTSLEA